MILHNKGQYSQALQILNDALNMSLEVGSRDTEGWTLHNLGSVYDSLGKKPEALGYYQQALAIRREVGDRGGEGMTSFNIGTALFQQHDVSLAALLIAKHLFEQVQSPSQKNVQSWIDSLRHDVGEEQFALLVVQVEPHAEQILEQFLKQEKG